MEYHEARFQDFSLLIFKDEKLKAIIPGHKVNATFYSHKGLSYGGIVVHETLKLNESVTLFKTVLQFLNAQGFKEAQIKMLPIIYNEYPSDEWLYLMFLAQAVLEERFILSVIDNSKTPLKLSTIRKRGIIKAETNGLIIKEESNFKPFWEQVLIPNLKKRFNQKPVHALTEIELLHSRFPDKIRQFNVYKDKVIVAGATIFETNSVAHAQYISANQSRQELGSLDFLFNHLIKNIFNAKLFFDFGTSVENGGKNINEGLLYWKESFGARTIIQDAYTVKTINYKLLNNIML